MDTAVELGDYVKEDRFEGIVIGVSMQENIALVLLSEGINNNHIDVIDWNYSLLSPYTTPMVNRLRAAGRIRYITPSKLTVIKKNAQESESDDIYDLLEELGS